MNKKLYVAAFLGTLFLSTSVCATAATVYLSDNQAYLYSVDTVNWQATSLGKSEQIMYDIAFSPAGSLYGINGGSNSALYELHPQTPTFSNYFTTNQIGFTGINTANALAINSSGGMYAANTKSDNIFSINPVDGSSSILGTLPRSSAGDLEFDRAGTLYMSGYRMANQNNQLISVSLNGNSISGTIIDATNGSAYTGLGIQNVMGLAWADDVMYGFSGRNAYTINLSTGIASFNSEVTGLAADTNFIDTEIYGAATQPSPVPLPSAVVLLGSGILSLIGTRARKNKK